MLPVVAVAVVGIVAIAGGGGRLEMVACSTQQQLVEDYYLFLTRRPVRKKGAFRRVQNTTQCSHEIIK
jgi:hypothetical protein